MISTTMMTMMATKSSVSTSAPSKLTVVCHPAAPLSSSNSTYGEPTLLATSSSQRRIERNGWQLFGHSFLKELQSFANTLRDFDDNVGGSGGHVADRPLQLLCPQSDVPNDSMSATDCGQLRHDAVEEVADIDRPPVPPPRRCRRVGTASLSCLSQSEPNLSVVDQLAVNSTNQDVAVEPKPRKEDDDGGPNGDNLAAVLSRLDVLDEEQSALPTFEVEVKAPSNQQHSSAACHVPAVPPVSIKAPMVGSTRCKNAYFQYPCPFNRNGYNNHFADTAPYEIVPSTVGTQRDDKSKPPDGATEVASKIPSLKHRSQRRSNGHSSEPVPPIHHDKDGHLACHRGDLILDKYEILDTLGEGTFGRVFEVRDLSKRSRKSLALKVIRNKRHYRESAQAEIDILNKLNQWDPEGKHLFVSLLHDFDYYGHVCLVFPKYGMSVFDFMKANSFVPYPMEQVRHIAYQLCFAVSFMHDHGLVHTDLKPENMIFVTDAYDVRPEPTSRKKEYRIMRDTSIRLIDFGATVFNRKDQTAIVSTRHYRAPEVILELGWSYPCDVWSIGCIIYELLKGVPMFQVHEDVEHLAMMQRVLGTLPQHMALKSKKNMFEYGRLRWDEHSSRGRYVRETLEPLNRCFQISDPVQAELFSLISDMLQYPPSARCRLGEVLNHRFFRRLSKHLRLHDIDAQTDEER